MRAMRSLDVGRDKRVFGCPECNNTMTQVVKCREVDDLEERDNPFAASNLFCHELQSLAADTKNSVAQQWHVQITPPQATRKTPRRIIRRGRMSPTSREVRTRSSFYMGGMSCCTCSRAGRRRCC